MSHHPGRSSLPRAAGAALLAGIVLACQTGTTATGGGAPSARPADARYDVTLTAERQVSFRIYRAVADGAPAGIAIRSISVAATSYPDGLPLDGLDNVEVSIFDPYTGSPADDAGTVSVPAGCGTPGLPACTPSVAIEVRWTAPTAGPGILATVVVSARLGDGEPASSARLVRLEEVPGTSFDGSPAIVRVRAEGTLRLGATHAALVQRLRLDVDGAALGDRMAWALIGRARLEPAGSPEGEGTGAAAVVTLRGPDHITVDRGDVDYLAGCHAWTDCTVYFDVTVLRRPAAGAPPGPFAPIDRSWAVEARLEYLLGPLPEGALHLSLDGPAAFEGGAG